jgi:hypothetical protein
MNFIMSNGHIWTLGKDLPTPKHQGVEFLRAK